MTVVGMYVCGAKQDLPFFMFCPAMTKFLNGCIGMPRSIRLHPHCGAKSSKWPLGPGVSRENPAPPFGTSNSANGARARDPLGTGKDLQKPFREHQIPVFSAPPTKKAISWAYGHCIRSNKQKCYEFFLLQLRICLWYFKLYTTKSWFMTFYNFVSYCLSFCYIVLPAHIVLNHVLLHCWNVFSAYIILNDVNCMLLYRVFFMFYLYSIFMLNFNIPCYVAFRISCHIFKFILQLFIFKVMWISIVYIMSCHLFFIVLYFRKLYYFVLSLVIFKYIGLRTLLRFIGLYYIALCFINFYNALHYFMLFYFALYYVILFDAQNYT
jgi:hypothetical protein